MKTNAAKASACHPPAEVGQASACHAPAEVGQASACHAPAWHPPRGFTLVELLVVIGIIGMLAAIITPVVLQSLTKARNSAIKAEIDMLHMAIMNYKNEYGSFPPCLSGTTASDPAAKHILRIFPRTLNLADEVQLAVTPSNSIGGWLLGYTDDPTRPVSGGTRNKLYDFDLARKTLNGLYHPSGKPNSPYIYIRSGTAASGGYGAIGGVATYTVEGQTYSPQIQVTASGTSFFNPDTFQILCAGRDEVFGNEDDLSNFWPGTRKEYSESK